MKFGSRCRISRQISEQLDNGVSYCANFILTISLLAVLSMLMSLEWPNPLGYKIKEKKDI